jgi:solute carrier family 45 protein 1/2/4
MPKSSLSLPQLAAVTVPMFGIGLAWSAQLSKVTPTLQVLGLSREMLGIAWLAGPVSGIIVQPLVAYMSDRGTLIRGCGRRRVWMWIGCIGLSLTMGIMAFAPEIGRAFGDRRGRQPAAILTATGSFWAMDFFINALQGPSRTLAVDICPPEQLLSANAMFAVWDSVGTLTGFLVGSIDWSSRLPGLSDEYAGDHFADVRALFGYTVLALLLTMALNTGLVCEPPAPLLSETKALLANPFEDIATVAVRVPKSVRCMFAVLFCIFCAWYTTWTFLPAYFGEVVFGGSSDPALLDADPLKAAYVEGARAYSLGNSIGAAVTLVAAGLLPLATVAVGEMRLFLALEVLHLALVAVHCTRIPVRSHATAVVSVALLGLPFSAFMLIPYAYVGRAANSSKAPGVYMSLMNLMLCFPELAVSLYSGPLIAAFDGSLRAPLMVGAAGCLVAVCTIALFFVLPELRGAPHGEVCGGGGRGHLGVLV